MPRYHATRDILLQLDPNQMNMGTCWMIGEMQMMRNKYCSEIGRQPVGWIMSIEEYNNIRNEIVEQMTPEQKRVFGEMNHFQGLPIVIKSSPGVELSMDINGAKFYTGKVLKRSLYESQ